MLMRFDPFRELDRELDRLTASVWGRAPSMPMDAYRDGDRFVVHLDLPGIDPDTVDVTVEKDVLTIAAERRWHRADDTQVLVSERPQGRFTRQLFLGDSLDTDRIEARYHDGVLTITIPVAEQARARKVEIARGNGDVRAIEATATEGAAEPKETAAAA